MPARARISPLHFLAGGCRSIGEQHIADLVTLAADGGQAFDVREDLLTLNFFWDHTA